MILDLNGIATVTSPTQTLWGLNGHSSWACWCARPYEVSFDNAILSHELYNTREEAVKACVRRLKRHLSRTWRKDLQNLHPMYLRYLHLGGVALDVIHPCPDVDDPANPDDPSN